MDFGTRCVTNSLSVSLVASTAWQAVQYADIPDGGTVGPFKTPGFGILDLTAYYKVSKDVTVNGGLYNLTDKKYWNWDDVRSYDRVGEAGVTGPANLDRLTQPGRNFAINVIWDI